MADQYAVGFKNKLDIAGNQGKNFEQVFPCDGGFITADANAPKSFIAGDFYKFTGNFFRCTEKADFPGVCYIFPGPAEEAAQITADAIGSGDAAVHVTQRDRFVSSDPGAYSRFVTFYALTHWGEWLFGLDAFGSFRLGYYATVAGVLLCTAAAVALAWRRPRAIEGALFLALFVLAEEAVLLPLLHYHQADGFYSHLFGAVPLLASWVLYGSIERPGPRILSLLAWIAATRFTYGLNLSDTFLAAAILAWLEARKLPPGRARAALWLLAAGLAGAAVVTAGLLLRVVPIGGGVRRPSLAAVLTGEALLATGLVAAAPAARRAGVSLAAGSERLARFAGTFGAVNLAVQILYLAAGLPRVYYIYKYSFHGVMLLTVAAVTLSPVVLPPVLAALGHRRPASLAAAALPVAVAIFLIGAGFGSFRRSFSERMLGKPPWSIIGPLVDPDALARARSVLGREGKRCGAVLIPSWPTALFMNATLGSLPSRNYETWADYAPALQAIGPGTCAFWYGGPDDLARFRRMGNQNGAVVAKVLELEALPDKRCDEYPARWDPARRIRLCHACF